MALCRACFNQSMVGVANWDLGPGTWESCLAYPATSYTVAYYTDLLDALWLCAEDFF